MFAIVIGLTVCVCLLCTYCALYVSCLNSFVNVTYMYMCLYIVVSGIVVLNNRVQTTNYSIAEYDLHHTYMYTYIIIPSTC